jgi:hypothetical protein
MAYIGTSINDSPTIIGPAGAAIPEGSFLAATFNAAGEFVVANATAVCIGLFPAETNTKGAGEDVTVQIKDIGLWKAGAAVAAGDLLTSNADGKAVTATGGKYVLAQALEAASAADQVIPVQIIKAGYRPAA